MYNKLFVNPAYAGMREAFCFTAIARQQWAGFDGSPRSGVFSADCFLPNVGGRGGSGVGVNVMYDQLGFESNMAYRLNYSFHQEIGDGGVLGIGIEAGAFSKRLGPTGSQQWLSTTNWQTDPTIPTQIKKTVPDLGGGVWYQQRNIWVGVSSTHLNASQINDGIQVVSLTTHNLLFQMARHYYVAGGINLPINPSWEIRPSFLVKSDATVTTVDLNVLAMFRQRFWFGASYRFKDAICPMAGFQIPNVNAKSNGMPDGGLKIGFAYDYTTSDLKNYNNGTFELFLNYCIPASNIFGVNSERFFN